MCCCCLGSFTVTRGTCSTWTTSSRPMCQDARVITCRMMGRNRNNNNNSNRMHRQRKRLQMGSTNLISSRSSIRCKFRTSHWWLPVMKAVESQHLFHTGSLTVPCSNKSMASTWYYWCTWQEPLPVNANTNLSSTEPWLSCAAPSPMCRRVSFTSSMTSSV